MGFLYHASCQEDGSVVLESQTVDRSDEEAFEYVMKTVEYDPEISLDAMTANFDFALMNKHGGYFFAGRRDSEQAENAWLTIQTHRDLIEHHLSELERIASLDIPEDELEYITKQHTYRVWATFKKRIDGQSNFAISDSSIANDPGSSKETLYQEMQQAYDEFALKGEAMIGCGGAIEASKTAKDMFDSIFGNKLPNKYDFNRKMFCNVCQAPPDKGELKKECGPCGLCRDCDKKARISSL